MDNRKQTRSSSMYLAVQKWCQCHTENANTLLKQEQTVGITEMEWKEKGTKTYTKVEKCNKTSPIQNCYQVVANEWSNILNYELFQT